MRPSLPKRPPSPRPGYKSLATPRRRHGNAGGRIQARCAGGRWVTSLPYCSAEKGNVVVTGARRVRGDMVTRGGPMSASLRRATGAQTRAAKTGRGTSGGLALRTRRTMRRNADIGNGGETAIASPVPTIACGAVVRGIGTLIVTRKGHGIEGHNHQRATKGGIAGRGGIDLP